jgi:hypothetical protein
MKPDQLYQEMKMLAEKLGISISEQNFRKTGTRIKSGFCTIKGEKYYYIDKDLPLIKKNEVLAEFLSDFEFENMYLFPAVREFLLIHKNK